MNTYPIHTLLTGARCRIKGSRQVFYVNHSEGDTVFLLPKGFKKLTYSAEDLTEVSKDLEVYLAK